MPLTTRVFIELHEILLKRALQVLFLIFTGISSKSSSLLLLLLRRFCRFLRLHIYASFHDTFCSLHALLFDLFSLSTWSAGQPLLRFHTHRPFKSLAISSFLASILVECARQTPHFRRPILFCTQFFTKGAPTVSLQHELASFEHIQFCIIGRHVVPHFYTHGG